MSRVMYKNNKMNVLSTAPKGALPKCANDNVPQVTFTPVLNDAFNMGAVHIDEDGFGGM